MNDDRIIRILRPSLALAALAAILVVLGLVIAGPAHAGTASQATPEPSPTQSGAVALQRGAEVQFGNDVVVPAGTTLPSVVVFGGDITVDGTVTDAVVAFGGDVRIDGTVGTATVAFGGDVTLGPDAVLGRDLTTNDAALVVFGGKLTRAPGAQVLGQTQTFDAIDWSGAVSWVGKGLFVNPWWGFSFVGWIVQTAFCLVLALVAAALMPRQLRSIQRHVGARPWPSLGWGALIVFITVPAILVVLVISIVGLLLVLPYVVAVLLAIFFVTTGASAFLAQKVLTGFGGKENLMLAVALGVVGTTVISRIPVAGPLLLLGLMVFGAGASALGLADWRRRRREAAALATATAGAAAPTASSAAPAATINPIVYTAPEVPAGTTPVESTPTVAAGPAAAVPDQAGPVGPGTDTVADAPAATAPPATPAAPEAPAAPTAPVPPPEQATPEVQGSTGEAETRENDDTGPASA